VPPPEVTPAPTQAIGPIVEGLPASVDEAPVLGGWPLRHAIEDADDDAAILAGGWFRAVETDGFYCPMIQLPRQYEWCPYGFELWDRRTGTAGIRLPVGMPVVVTEDLTSGPDRAVVLRIHTHDAACRLYAESDEQLANCHSRVVVDAIAWLGDPETEPPVPTTAPKQPTGGLTRNQAIERAREVVASTDWIRRPLRCAAVRLQSELFGGLDPEENPWAWLVRFGDDEHEQTIVIGYRAGKFLYASAGTAAAKSCDEPVD